MLIGTKRTNITKIVVVSIVLSSGCNVIPGLIFTSRYCEYPGVCGQPSRILLAFSSGISEFIPEKGSAVFAYPSYTGSDSEVANTGGLVFVNTEYGLKLLYGTTSGLVIHDGTEAFQPGKVIALENCQYISDLAVFDSENVILGCSGTNRLIKYNFVNEQTDEGFQCCIDINESFIRVLSASLHEFF